MKGGTLALQYGTGAREPRDRDDLYVEPPEVVAALCRVERFIGPIWDPACGTGSLLRALQRCGYGDVVGSDIARAPPTLDDPGDDFTRPDMIPPLDPVVNIVTNPPYRLAERFALRALAIATGKVALFLRLQWLEGSERHRTIFSTHPPTRVWVFTHRLGMQLSSGRCYRDGMVSYAWFVWDLTAPNGRTELHWISAREK